jgi:hypothetical protein
MFGVIYKRWTLPVLYLGALTLLPRSHFSQLYTSEMIFGLETDVCILNHDRAISNDHLIAHQCS